METTAQRGLMRAAAVVDRRFSWARLPKPLALITLSGIRMALRRENLFDPRGIRLPWGPAAPPSQPRSLTRSADGTGNNLDYLEMGRAGSPFGRNVPLSDCYPTDVLTPSPRVVSQELLARDEFHKADTLNLLAAAWLQFEIHDWLSHGGNRRIDPWVIDLPDNDPWPHHPMRVRRSHAPDSTITSGPPAYPNRQTHWWDASQLYGSDSEMQHRLRSHTGGRLLLGPDRLVPIDEATGRDLAGVTGNWWVGLAMMHGLFIQEHNAICEMLSENHRDWSDDQLFEVARLINAALIAKIQTIEWSTAVVANSTMRTALLANWWGLAGEWFTRHFGRISRRDEISGVPGSATDLFGVPYAITEEFVSVYRMHPLLPDHFQFQALQDDHLLRAYSLSDVLFGGARKVLEEVAMPDALYSFGINSPGALTLHNYPKDLQQLRRPDGEFIDLGTVEILRDRERGVPRYNQFRRRVHLAPKTYFRNFSDDPEIVAQLRAVYADPEQVDLLVGLLAEAPPPGFAFSDTAFRVFILMATRRLKSDRFYTYDYRPEVYTAEGLEWIASNSMGSVLARHYPALAGTMRGVTNAFKPWSSHG